MVGLDNRRGAKLMRVPILLVALVVAASLATSALAGGNSSTRLTYENKGAKVQGVIGKQVTKTPKKHQQLSVKTKGTVTTGTLPFTGLDLGFITGGALLLVLTGASLRRITRSRAT